MNRGIHESHAQYDSTPTTFARRRFGKPLLERLARANTDGLGLFAIHTQFAILSKNVQCFVDKHASQPTDKNATRQ